MKKKHAPNPLLVLIILSIFFSIPVAPSYAQPSVAFEVSRAIWGEDPNNPIKAYPGDMDQSLTVEVQNLSPNKTIKGVKAVLMLQGGPFTDIYGSQNATATGVPEVGDLLNPTDEIKPKGFFTLTFNLDISDHAVPGRFQYDMTLDYSVNVSGSFLNGEPKLLLVEFFLSKIDSVIACSVSPQTIEKGESVDVSGSITPSKDNATINLHYEDLNGSVTVDRAVVTSPDGSFQDSFQPTLDGQWRVNASWAGDVQHNSDWAMASFEVRFDAVLRIITSDNRLAGGLDNQFNITLINEGLVQLSTIDVTVTIPSPLILYDIDNWTFEYLKPKDSISIALLIFVPDSVVGSTYRGTITLSYRDYYGVTHTESQTLGLIIIGQIVLVVFDKTASLQSVTSQISVTATLLNKGNVAARYVNATIVSSSILDLTTESTTYIGEVEENAPTPFTLMAVLKSNVENGTYTFAVTICYRDDQYIDHSFDFTIPFTFVKTSGNQNGSNNGQALGPYTQVLIFLIIILTATSAIILLYRRHRRTR